MNRLGTEIAIGPAPYPSRYDTMRLAIRECHSVDECRGYSDKAIAMAAYFKQVADKDSVRQFNEIKLRAWRRIGEILLETGARGNTLQQQIASLREKLAGRIDFLSDHQMRQAIMLAEIPSEKFEISLDEVCETGGLTRMIDAANPRRVETREKEVERRADMDQRMALQRAREQAIRQAAQTSDADEEVVGLTLERKYNKPMKKFEFLMGAKLHQRVREAAFVRAITMHELLRQAVNLWFASNKVDVHIPREE